jgi:hypothetical protein
MSVLCGGTIAVAALAPMHQGPSGDAGAQPAAAVALADRQHAQRGNEVSRGTQRAAPSPAGSELPVQDATAPASPAPPAPSASPSKPAPRPKARPTRPSLPVIAGLDRYQVENAQTIVNVGRAMGISERGQIIAIATALQESNLYNLYIAVDHDSLGLFQQRPSAGWGSPGQLTTPSYAARAFYARLLDTTADWGCLTCAAQRVQGSAFPDAYAAHEWFATTIVGALTNR